MLVKRQIGALYVQLDLGEPSPETAHVLRVLQQLGSVDSDFATVITELCERYQLRGLFTPRQMLLVQWRLSKHGIAHTPSCFTVSVSTPKEIAQLRGFDDWRRQKLAPYLSWQQRSQFGF